MKVMVLSLYNGENEFYEMISSVKNQTYSDIDHVVYENLDNQVAHETLYNRIMDEKDNYDIFLKLDADMVIESESLIEDVVNIFRRSRDLDFYSITVYDHFTNSNIWGANFFSARCEWKQSNEMVFVDHQPVYPGRRERSQSFKRCISHCKNPSKYQSFIFGLHRAIKIVQSNAGKFSIGKSWVQIKTVLALRSAYKARKTYYRQEALRGASCVFGDRGANFIFMTNKSNYVELYENYGKGLDPKYFYKKTGFLSMIMTIGWFRVVRAALRKVLFNND